MFRMRLNVKCLIACGLLFIFICMYNMQSHFWISNLALTQPILHGPSVWSASSTVVASNGNSSMSDLNSILFIHVPKAGGTAFTTVLREIQCKRDPKKFPDCCRHPGSCYIKVYRRCISILGCVSHHPRTHLLDSVRISIGIFREPVARAVSGWFYSGHNPNNDAFEVRPEFMAIRKGQLPKVTFEQYMHYPEYRDVQTRMLGTNSFPYRNVTVDGMVLSRATAAVDKLFCVALQEELVVSAMLLTRLLGMASAEWDARIASLPVERAATATAAQDGILYGNRTSAVGPAEATLSRGQTVNGFSVEARDRLLQDPEISGQIRALNRHDVQLYAHVVRRFCSQVQPYPELVKLLQNIRCDGNT